MSNKSKKKKKIKVRPQPSSHISTPNNLNPKMPLIVGADFSPEFPETIEYYEQKISKLPKRSQKLKVLFCGEASFLSTGFSNYYKSLLTRLHARGNIEIYEFGSYGGSREQDPRAAALPWHYYHNLPTNQMENQQYHADYKENQFGKWKLDYVLADCKPDVVVEIRDWWMMQHVNKSKFRDKFCFVNMCCVDGYPQRWEWLKTYNNVDVKLAYSYFGKRVLEAQTRTQLALRTGTKPITVRNVMQTGVDLKIFKPLDKAEVFKAFGITDTNMKFVGTVMRNQPRKLFPRILESFRLFKEQYPEESRNVNLLLHTSCMDVGWDIPGWAAYYGLENEVVYTYICMNCGAMAISQFLPVPNPNVHAQCPNCKQNTFINPNTSYGIDQEHLNMIYNLMDVYVQGSIAEGCGVPVLEAKAAGIPCLCSDYSALYEKNRNGGSLPIRNQSLDPEHETGQLRSKFDVEDLAHKLATLMSDKSRRDKMGKEARECVEKYYDADLMAIKWEYELLSAPIKDRSRTWEAPLDLKKLPDSHPPSLPNTLDGHHDWLTWCYVNILNRKGIDSDGLHYWTRVLMNSKDVNKTKLDLENHFRQMIQDENNVKLMAQNSKLASPNPVERISAMVKDIDEQDLK